MPRFPEITDALLADLDQELGGCDFSAAPQRDFLGCATSRDVQAAPGSGKTTLLVAKLDLLARAWGSRRQGICVISHTNAAREEVERLLSDHPSGAALLAYPHFVGTVTAFSRTSFLPCRTCGGWGGL